MSIDVVETGNPEKPILVCLPGMIGGPSDFRRINAGLEEAFRLLVIDINPQTRDEGIKGLSEESVSEINYRSVAQEVSDYLEENYPKQPVYLIGLSIGGKIAYHFIADHPEKFLGGVITDITPGLMDHTELYRTVIETVTGLNLKQDWGALKKDLADKIEDRNFRVLIKSQIFFPKPGGPAEWRNGMDGLEDLLKRSSTDDLWTQLKDVEAQLVREKKRLIVFKADVMSGIAPEDQAKLSEYKFVEIEPVRNATHFLHINEVEKLREGVLSLV